MKITLADQLGCIRRELTMRTAFYPQLVRQGRLRSSEAEREIAVMEAVLATLEDVARDRRHSNGTRLRMTLDDP